MCVYIYIYTYQKDLEARVVLIFKKGNTEDLKNYRPISLLNTLYKIFAAIIQRRLAKHLDKHLQKTQYGFRKDKSTADAIQCVRRMADYGEQTKGTGLNIILVLLDLEKAFDKIDREELMLALQRLGVPDKYTRIITNLYTDRHIL